MKLKTIDAFTFKEQINKRVALIPVGAVEIHGAHLPTGTDSILAEKICEKVAAKIPSVIFPTLHYTQVWSLGDFIGSVSLSSGTFTKMLIEILLEVERNGFKTVALINTHLGNNNAIKEAAREVIKSKPHFKVLYFTYPGAGEVLKSAMNSANFHGGFFHADEIETSYMLYLAPEMVDMTKAVKGEPVIPELLDITPIRWSEFTDNGVMGDATAATAEKGEKVIIHVVNKIVELISKAEKEKR